jgi:hypothetical protein
VRERERRGSRPPTTAAAAAAAASAKALSRRVGADADGVGRCGR